jgi:superfamily II DNA/RNA helicase
VDVLPVYGGKAIQPQIDAIADGAHLVVGTPGRLLDLVRRGVLDLSAVAGLVLDEADEMLDLGFLPDVEALIEQCSSDRQTLLFSATMPAAIVGLARRYMSKPTFMRADVEEINIAPKTKQHFFSCHRMDKPAVVARILQAPSRGLCLVFCRTKRMADILAEELRERDVTAQAIHSDLRQDARERVLQKFRDGTVTVLCATEVAARGLDIDDVTHVVNYDCPDDEKMYLHRIGRTGRAGANGVAITFAVWNELPRLEMIRRELGIQDEVHEVFSTSPLLDELFDLPAREERKKVASTPQARSGKGTRDRTDDDGSKRGRRSGGRGGRKDAAEESTARSGGDDGDRSTSADEGSSPRRSPSGSAPPSGGDDDGTSRTRRRTRTRGEGDSRTAARDEGDDTATASATAETAPATASRNDRSTEDEGTTTRRRRRSRGGRGTPDRDERAGKTTSDESDAPVRSDGRTRPQGRSRSESPAGREGRDRSSRAGTDGDGDGDGDGAAEGGQRTRGGDSRRGRTADDVTSGGDSPTKSGTSKSGTSRAGSSRGGSASSSGGSRSGSSSDESRGSRDGGRGSRGGSRGRSSGGSRDGRGSQDERGGRNGQTRRPAIDHTEARGDGAPRLTRKLEVEHLP